MLTTEYDFVFKLLLIGDSSVGKSSLLLRFADNVFNESFLPTIGVDFKIRTIENDGSLIKLQMWDTAGQEKFKTITAAYYKGSHGIILVYDVCDRRSFLDVQNWLNEAERYSSPDVVKILVGNKCDMESQREVSKEEAERFAHSMDMKFIESSAKMNTNVEKVFTELSLSMKKKFSNIFQEKNKKKSEQQQQSYLSLRKLETNLNNGPKKTCC